MDKRFAVIYAPKGSTDLTEVHGEYDTKAEAWAALLTLRVRGYLATIMENQS